MWGKYLKEFWEKIKRFIQNPIIVIYFLSVVVVVGSFGVWYNYFDYKEKDPFFTDKNTLSNLATYAISIIAATMADFLLSNKNRGKGIKIFAFSLFLLAFLGSVISMVQQKLIFGVMGLILTYILWIIVYSDDDSKGVENAEPEAPRGGPDPQGQIIPGTTANFKI